MPENKQKVGSIVLEDLSRLGVFSSQL